MTEFGTQTSSRALVLCAKIRQVVRSSRMGENKPKRAPEVSKIQLWNPDPGDFLKRAWPGMSQVSAAAGDGFSVTNLLHVLVDPGRLANVDVCWNISQDAKLPHTVRFGRIGWVCRLPGLGWVTGSQARKVQEGGV